MDGSGGEHTSDARLRRCGFSSVKIQEDIGHREMPELQAAAFGPLPGTVQTVPRAELFFSSHHLEIAKRHKRSHHLGD